MIEIDLSDEAATLAVGAALAESVSQGVVFLVGELGAGKTTLVRGWLQALGHQGHVKSPTYTLVEPYLLSEREVFHFDLYRLANPEEVEDFGLRDYLSAQALCLIEWPSQAQGMLPAPDLCLTLAHADQGRRLRLVGANEPIYTILQNNLKKYLYL